MFDDLNFQAVTIESVHAQFERVLRNRNDMGLRNLLGDTLLEPRNPFQKSRRRPRRWVVALIGILLLAFLIIWYFHLR
jgi:hypothetical protein